MQEAPWLCFIFDLRADQLSFPVPSLHSSSAYPDNISFPYQLSVQYSQLTLLYNLPMASTTAQPN